MPGSGQDISSSDLGSYIDTQGRRSLLRFLTCGSVDDGKSTLIGRLLYDAMLLFDDQVADLENDSRKHGGTGDEIDFSLLVDGLDAEREQGITIDVAYRFFSTERRKFVVADTPGHEEYTRNMATGASTAHLAIVLVDCCKGILQQTCRHTYIASLLGIKHIVLAVNKIDLAGYGKDVFDRIERDYHNFAKSLGFATVQAIPLSARYGDNVTRSSPNTLWYTGPTLLGYLEAIEVDNLYMKKPFRFPVQYVSRHSLEFRGFAGQIASGSVRVGDLVTIAKSGQHSVVKEIVTGEGSVEKAIEGQAITILLQDQIDVSRGNMIVSSDDRPNVADQFQAHIIWFDMEPMMPGRNYILRTESDNAGVTITALKYKVDVNTLAHLAAKALNPNEIAVCNLSTHGAIVFDSYTENRRTGNFILIDRLSNRTVGAGMIDFALRRAQNVHWQSIEVDSRARARQKQQRPAAIWFTGLSGSGKSTIANRLEKLLLAKGRHTYILDGDNVRHGLNRDLGFTDEDRVENIRRVAEVAKLMTDAGLIVLVSFISPFRSERRLARELFQNDEFIEVFIDTPIEECARRDPKGLYKKAMSGMIANFTGISSAYERPENPELHLETIAVGAEELAIEIEAFLESRISAKDDFGDD